MLRWLCWTVLSFMALEFCDRLLSLGVFKRANEGTDIRRLTDDRNISITSVEAGLASYGFYTDWKETRVWSPRGRVRLWLPAAVQQGYAEKCDIHSASFQFHNREELKKSGLPVHRIASPIAVLKIFWMLFKIASAFIFAPSFLASRALEWRRCDQTEVNTTWCMKYDDSGEYSIVISKREFQVTDAEVGHVLMGQSLEGEAALAILRQAYDPQDVMQTASLAQVLPRSPAFDPRAAEQFFAGRLQARAKMFGVVVLPWSQRMQIAIFFGNMLQGMLEIMKVALLGPPRFWVYYTYDWWTSTFRPEVSLPLVYFILRFLALSYQLEQFLGTDDQGARGGTLMRILEVPSWVMCITLGIMVWPFVPALLLMLLPVCMYGCCFCCCCVFTCMFDLKRVDTWFLGNWWLQAGVVTVIVFAWTWYVGQVSMRYFSVSEETYLCPFSQFEIAAKSPDSIGGFTFLVCCFTLLLAAGVGALASITCIPKLLTMRFCMDVWLRRSHVQLDFVRWSGDTVERGSHEARECVLDYSRNILAFREKLNAADFGEGAPLL